ncbi:MAG: EamA family transporter [Acidobacteriota bacterium]
MSTTTPSLRPAVLLAFAAIYVIWGSTYLAIRFAIETIPPLLMAGWRVVLAGGLLYGALRLAGVPRPSVPEVRTAAGLGVLMIAGAQGLVTWAEQLVPSGLAALMITSMPLVLVGLDVAFFGAARPGPRTLVGLGLGLVGVASLVGPSEGAVHPVGAAALLLSTLCWAIGSLLSRGAAMPRSPWMSAAVQMLAGGVVLLGAATVAGEWSVFELSAVSALSLGSFLYLTTFGSIVALSAYLFLLRETSAAAVGTYAFVNPVIALGLGWAAGEVMSASSLVGGTLVIGAVVLIHLEHNRSPVPRRARAEISQARPATPCPSAAGATD